MKSNLVVNHRNETIGSPIDAATERTVKELIKKHGLAKVSEHLYAIMYKASWGDWQRVQSLVGRMNNQIERDRRAAEKLACKTW